MQNQKKKTETPSLQRFIPSKDNLEPHWSLPPNLLLP